MDVPVITWCAIVAIFVSIVLFRVAMYVLHTRHATHSHQHLRHHIIEVGSEREELFIPGDPTGHENYPPYARTGRQPDDDE